MKKLFNTVSSLWKSFKSPDARGFLAGIALSFPLVAHSLPSSYKALDYVVFLPLTLHLLASGIRLTKIKFQSPLIAIILLVMALNTVGLATSDSAYAAQTLKDIIRTIILFGFFIVSLDADYKPEKMTDGFFFSAIALSAVSTPLGMAKMFLYERGILIKYFLVNCAERYPQGAALCGDYNMFGLSILVGIIGILYFFLRSKQKPIHTIILLLLLTAFMTTGLYAGSKRFLLLFLVLPIFIIIGVWKNLKQKWILFVVLLPFIVSTHFFLNESFKSSQKNKDFVVVDSIFDANIQRPKNMTALSLSELQKIGTPRAVDPNAMASTFSEEQAFGFTSRVQHWIFALSLLKDNYLTGMGFDYHLLYSCEFTDCLFIDYPHLTILSGGLISGLLGGLVVTLFYVFLLFQVYKLGIEGWRTGITPLSLLIMPYSLLSGDTILSVPQTISIALILEAYVISRSLNLLTKRNFSMLANTR